MRNLLKISVRLVRLKLTSLNQQKIFMVFKKNVNDISRLGGGITQLMIK